MLSIKPVVSFVGLDLYHLLIKYITSSTASNPKISPKEPPMVSDKLISSSLSNKNINKPYN